MVCPRNANDLTPRALRGRDVLLRPACSDDARRLAAWHSDPDFVGSFFDPWPESSDAWEERISTRTPEEDTFLICERNAGEKPIGTAGYWNPYTLPRVFRGLEIWYKVHPSSRGRGVATQTASLLLDHLFNSLPVERIQATVVSANEASRRALLRVGMQCEGILRRVYFLHGTYVDVDMFSIVREEWNTRA